MVRRSSLCRALGCPALAFAVALTVSACRPPVPALTRPADDAVSATGTAQTLLATALGVPMASVLEAQELPVEGVPGLAALIAGRYADARYGGQAAVVPVLVSEGKRLLGVGVRLGPADQVQLRGPIDLGGEPRQIPLQPLASTPQQPRLVAPPNTVHPAVFARFDIRGPAGGRGVHAVLLSVNSGRLRIVWREQYLWQEGQGGFTSSVLGLEKGPEGYVDFTLTQQAYEEGGKKVGAPFTYRFRRIGGRYLRIR